MLFTYTVAVVIEAEDVEPFVFSSLLNDVSTMTRLENGADMIAVESVNMHDLVYQIESDLPANNLSGNLEFSFDIPFF